MFFNTTKCGRRETTDCAVRFREPRALREVPREIQRNPFMPFEPTDQTRAIPAHELPPLLRPRESFGSKLRKFFGPLAVVGVIALKIFAKLKFLVVPLLKFLPVILKSGGSMILMIWVYASIWGWKWGVGFVVLLLLHECGHLLAAKHFGLQVSAPMFIPFMGAFIALKEAPRNAWIEAGVGIGGPLLGSAAALVCHAIGLGLNAPLFIGLAWTAYF